MRGEGSIQEQVSELRQALENARSKILEQQAKLAELTSPPFAYATVLTTSKWLGLGSSDACPLFMDINGSSVDVDPEITSLGGYQVRNHLVLKTESIREVPEVVRKAKKHIVVGFTTGTVVIQLDAGVVYQIPFSKSNRLYKILGKQRAAEKSKPDTAVIIMEGKFFEVLLPESLEIKPGDTVTIVIETFQIIDVASVQLGGDIAYVRSKIDELFSEVDYQAGTKVVFNGKFGRTVEKGDRVVLDGTNTIIVRDLGKDDDRFQFTAETDVSWDDIGGLVEEKRQMIEAVELPHTHPDIFRFYGKRPIKGILLYGPPGCGKTMLGKATVTALARIYNGEAKGAGFIYVKGPEILDRFVGVAESTIRQIFQRARKHKETHGYPAVIFIDEADAILAKRGSGISSDIERTIVPMFLTEMDGLEDSGALIILATNRSDILDPAVVRDGRIDRKIRVGRPTVESATEIFLLNLRRVPLKTSLLHSVSHEELAQLGACELFSPRRVLYRIQTNQRGTLTFTLANIVNGGMIVNVVEQATSIALHRDLNKKKPEGLLREDIVGAVDMIERQNRELNHTDELGDFVHDFRKDVVSIQRLRQASP